MMSQPSGNRPQIAGDDRTQLLPPVARQSRPERAAVAWDGWDERLAEHLRPKPVTVAQRWRTLDPETEQRLVAEWAEECRKTAAANWMLDRAALTAPYRLGYGFGPQRDDETAVIPVTPAQPGADWDRPELPDCKKRSMAIALIFGAGMVIGALIATIRWWFG